MIEGFVGYLNSRVPLEESEIDFIHSHVSVATFEKGEYLLREGQVSDRFFYNLSGFVRLFYNVDGEEVTAFFYPEGEFISAYESYLHMKPAVQNFQAVEKTTVAVITREAANEFMTCHPRMVQLAMTALEEELVTYQRVIASLLTQDPEARYLKMLDEHGDYFNRIPQQHIASYIGVKPESLSRIKKRVAEKS